MHTWIFALVQVISSSWYFADIMHAHLGIKTSTRLRAATGFLCLLCCWCERIRNPRERDGNDESKPHHSCEWDIQKKTPVSKVEVVIICHRKRGLMQDKYTATQQDASISWEPRGQPNTKEQKTAEHISSPVKHLGGSIMMSTMHGCLWTWLSGSYWCYW